jgi:hypothetical protein
MKETFGALFLAMPSGLEQGTDDPGRAEGFGHYIISDLCTRQKFKTPALNHMLRATISGFCPLTVIMSGGHKNSSNSLNLSSIFWSPCKRLLVR